MIETQGKLLFLSFFTILIGIVLIQPIANDIELAKVSLNTVLNESVSLTAVTQTITNESITLSLGPPSNRSGTTTHNYVTSLTVLKNSTDSQDDILGFCNITLNVDAGTLRCNDTGNFTAYATYTYNKYSTGSLSSDQDEWKSFDACRNNSMAAISTGVDCNVSLNNGAVTVNYDNFTTFSAYIDYKYEPDTYVYSSAARVLLTNTRLFFAIAVMIVGVGFAVLAFKQSGVM